MASARRGAGVLAVLVVALPGCGSDGATTTTNVGEGQLTVSTTAAATDVEAIREIVDQLPDQLGLTEEVGQCYREEFAAIPDAELQRYLDLMDDDLARTELQERLLPVTQRLNRRCVPNVGPTVNADVDPNQIALIREQTKRHVGAALRHENVPEPLIACILGHIEALSDREMIEASNESVRAADKRLLGWARNCR